MKTGKITAFARNDRNGIEMKTGENQGQPFSLIIDYLLNTRDSHLLNPVFFRFLTPLFILGLPTGSGRTRRRLAGLDPLYVALNGISDIRLKDNITTIDSGLDKITSIRGVEFNWKDGAGEAVGFIAQEVQPDCGGRSGWLFGCSI